MCILYFTVCLNWHWPHFKGLDLIFHVADAYHRQTSKTQAICSLHFHGQGREGLSSIWTQRTYGRRLTGADRSIATEMRQESKIFERGRKHRQEKHRKGRKSTSSPFPAFVGWVSTVPSSWQLTPCSSSSPCIWGSQAWHRDSSQLGTRDYRSQTHSRVTAVLPLKFQQRDTDINYVWAKVENPLLARLTNGLPWIQMSFVLQCSPQYQIEKLGRMTSSTSQEARKPRHHSHQPHRHLIG